MTREVVAPFRILTPLLAFERVSRRTGAIRRTCVFHNDGGHPLRLKVRYGFVEHSWLQLYADDGAVDDSHGETLQLEPGATKVHVLLNTDSTNFPYDRFRGRVWFEDPEDARIARWMEISFEQIEELTAFAGYAAIDLGTSNSTLALYHLQHDAVSGMPWTPALEGGETDVPSAVFVRDLAQFKKLADGSCAVGRVAQREYAQDPANDPRSLQQGVKRQIGSDRLLAVDARGAGGYVDPLAVLYMLARSVRERAQGHEQVRARLEKLIVTYPPTWDYRQIERWKEVFRRLGFADADLDLSLDEASAAGLFYVHEWTRDQDARNRLLQDLLPSMEPIEEDGRRGERYLLELLCFDFGGGTTDLALIRVKLTVFDDVIRMRVTLRGSDSLPFGGDQVTLAVFRILKRRIALGLSDPDRLAGGERLIKATRTEAHADGMFLLPSQSAPVGSRAPRSTDAARERLRARWDDVEAAISCDRLPGELEDLIDAVLPTRFWRSPEEPIDPAAKQNFAWLWERAEMLKRELFREANRRERGLPLGPAPDVRGGVRLADLPDRVADRRLRDSQAGQARAGVAVDDVYRAIAAPLEEAVARARRLAGSSRVDRIVLTGQSSWIPLVRRLFVRPRGEGGFGLAPSKIEFDEANAKAAVAKGACLLRVMRDALVGFDVDVSDFKANLLGEMFYRSPLGGKRTLFGPGPIDDLGYVEEAPDPKSFARHLTVFHGAPDNVLGQFDFEGAGEALPDFSQYARHTAARAKLEGGMPSHDDLMRRRNRDPEADSALVGALRDWPERAIVAWIEQTARAGSADRPVYRYYLTRNRNLLSVRDRGNGDRRLFTLVIDDHARPRPDPHEDPFSGWH